MYRNPSLLFPVLFMGLFSFLYSCKTKPQFAPDAPEEKYNRTGTSLPRHLSSVTIPVQIQISELEQALNSKTEGILYEDNSLENNGKDNLMLKVWKRRPIIIEATGDVFSLRVPVKVWARVRYGFDRFGIRLYDYRETDFELDIKFITRISVTPDWQIATNTTAGGYEWIKKPFVRFGPIEIPVAPTVGRIISQQQPALAARLDEQVQKQLLLRQYVEQAWGRMQNPFKISDDYQTWVKITPSEVFISPLHAAGGTVRARIGIRGYTETFTGREPESDHLPLPALQMSGEVPGEFTIGISSQISHQYAAELVSKRFVNQSFGSKRYAITVTSVDLYGNGDHLIIKAGVKGSIDGTIYLRGKPYYDVASQSIALHNLDYDLDSRSKLLLSANWLLRGTFLKRMNDAFRLPVGKQLADARQNLQEKLRENQVSKGIFLNGQLDELTPSSVIITPGSIFAVVLAKGKAEVRITGLL